MLDKAITILLFDIVIPTALAATGLYCANYALKSAKRKFVYWNGKEAHLSSDPVTFWLVIAAALFCMFNCGLMLARSI